MIRQTFLVLIILTTLFGCDFSKQVKDAMDNTLAEMDTDIINAKSDFTKSYQNALEKSTDSILSIKMNDLYSSIVITSKYIDSLRIEMGKLDDMDVKNVELVKELFLHKGIGDSVFNKVKQTYSQTIDIAITDTTKSRLRKIHDTFTEETKKHFFELNSPMGVNMILCGVESELIKDGERCLYGYTTK